jgi:hypothetical protein
MLAVVTMLDVVTMMVVNVLALFIQVLLVGALVLCMVVPWWLVVLIVMLRVVSVMRLRVPFPVVLLRVMPVHFWSTMVTVVIILGLSGVLAHLQAHT